MFDERESRKRASASDNRNSVNPLHATGYYNNPWTHRSFLHTMPYQRGHEMDCYLHGAIARTVPEAASLNRLNHSDQRPHRQRSSRRIYDAILASFRRKNYTNGKRDAGGHDRTWLARRYYSRVGMVLQSTRIVGDAEHIRLVLLAEKKHSCTCSVSDTCM